MVSVKFLQIKESLKCNNHDGTYANTFAFLLGTCRIVFSQIFSVRKKIDHKLKISKLFLSSKFLKEIIDPFVSPVSSFYNKILIYDFVTIPEMRYTKFLRNEFHQNTIDLLKNRPSERAGAPPKRPT